MQFLSLSEQLKEFRSACLFWGMDNFGGKQDEYLETDKFGQTAYSLFRRVQQQAIGIL